VNGGIVHNGGDESAGGIMYVLLPIPQPSRRVTVRVNGETMSQDMFLHLPAAQLILIPERSSV